MRHRKAQRLIGMGTEETDSPRRHKDRGADCRAPAQDMERLLALLRAARIEEADPETTARIARGIADGLATAGRKRYPQAVPAWPGWAPLRAAALVCIGVVGYLYLSRPGGEAPAPGGPLPLASPVTNRGAEPPPFRLALPAPVPPQAEVDIVTHRWQQVEQPVPLRPPPRPRMVDFQP